MPAPVVLIIDDEPQIRRLLRVTLEANGYRVFDAATGQDGIVQAAQRRPDVVLLDLGLPDVKGLEVLKRLREWSRMPVIILSVCDGEEDKVGALDAGADDYVTKPFNSAELLARLRTALRHTQPPGMEVFFAMGIWRWICPNGSCERPGWKSNSRRLNIPCSACSFLTPAKC